MVREGADAPAVSLPAYVNGERERVDLGEYIGEGIVVLAFYPADFNPACTVQDSDLGDLDLFTMQKDVSVFAVSPDSTYSHAAFADQYGLHVPLLSDVDGEAAAAYDVATETELGETLVERAVFVVDHRGVVQYVWSTDDLATEIDVAPVKETVGSIGGDDTALDRYRVGYDHYVEGRGAFIEAMSEYEDGEWMVAFNGFDAAQPAFATAADHFDTAVRFAETEAFEEAVDMAEEKADTLQHATDWLADSADAISSGRGKQGQQYRSDAQRLLDAAADLPDPPAPDALELTDAGIEMDDSVTVEPETDEGYAWRADDSEPVDTDLGVGEDELDAAVEGDLEMDLDASDSTSAPPDESRAGTDPGAEADAGIPGSEYPADPSDDGQPSETAADGDDAGGAVGDQTGTRTEAGEGDDAGDEPEVEELDLADPTEGEDDDDDDDDGERVDWDVPGR